MVQIVTADWLSNKTYYSRALSLFYANIRTKASITSRMKMNFLLWLWQLQEVKVDAKGWRMNRLGFSLSLLTVLSFIPPAACSLNLYINSTEAKKILGGLLWYDYQRNNSWLGDLILKPWLYFFFTGVEGDIYYIRDSKIKPNAVRFNMTVPTQVNCLRFVWYSKRIPPKPLVSSNKMW